MLNTQEARCLNLMHAILPPTAINDEEAYQRRVARLESAYGNVETSRRNFIAATIDELLEDHGTLMIELSQVADPEFDAAVKLWLNAKTPDELQLSQAMVNDRLRVYAGKCAELAADREWPCSIRRVS